MARASKTRRHLLNAARRARLGRSNHGSYQELQLDPTSIVTDSSVDDISHDEISDDENELCNWPGGVNNHFQIESELLEENWLDLPAVIEGEFSDMEEEDEDLCDQEGEELRNSLEECIMQEARANINAYENLTRKISDYGSIGWFAGWQLIQLA